MKNKCPLFEYWYYLNLSFLKNRIFCCYDSFYSFKFNLDSAFSLSVILTLPLILYFGPLFLIKNLHFYLYIQLVHHSIWFLTFTSKTIDTILEFLRHFLISLILHFLNQFHFCISLLFHFIFSIPNLNNLIFIFSPFRTNFSFIKMLSIYLPYIYLFLNSRFKSTILIWQ